MRKFPKSASVLSSPTFCPVCEHELGVAFSFEHKRPPEPGSVILCLKYSNPLIVAEDGKLRSPTDDERRMIEALPQFRQMVEEQRLIRSQYLI